MTRRALLRITNRFYMRRTLAAHSLPLQGARCSFAEQSCSRVLQTLGTHCSCRERTVPVWINTVPACCRHLERSVPARSGLFLCGATLRMRAGTGCSAFGGRSALLLQRATAKGRRTRVIEPAYALFGHYAQESTRTVNKIAYISPCEKF